MREVDVVLVGEAPEYNNRGITMHGRYNLLSGQGKGTRVMAYMRKGRREDRVATVTD